MKILNIIKTAGKRFIDILPYPREEDVAMFYKDHCVLIPICAIEELSDVEEPDAVCRYRMIRWMGTDYHIHKIGDPMDPNEYRRMIWERKGIIQRKERTRKEKSKIMR